MKKEFEQQGLYTPQVESDACGTGMYVSLKKEKSNTIVDKALTMLENMEHRGACGCDPNSGDGAGILTHLPHSFFEKNLKFELPEEGRYGVGMMFFPNDEKSIKSCEKEIEKAAKSLNFKILGYREVPTDNTCLGPTSRSVEPCIKQVFFTKSEYLKEKPNAKDFDRKLFVLRKLITQNIIKSNPEFIDDFYIPSLTCRIIIYKGQLTSHQVRKYYPDLSHPDFETAIALVHSRFATNTVPRWKLAQPFRCISHNGEINTVQGNINWWRSREATLESSKFTKEELDILLPIIDNSGSDSACFDNVLEFLVHAGRSIPEALMMMIPEAWQNDNQIGQAKKDFYEYHENLMEPWDGPASICFTDGTLVGATLDRNGLRPSRFCVTKNKELILASETGVIPISPEDIVLKDRLEPGKILIADLDDGCIIEDGELKNIICNRQDYNKWLAKRRISVKDMPINMPNEIPSAPLRKRQIAHGMTAEDRDEILAVMSKKAKEPIGSMGTDTPLAVLSKFAQHPANYFKQNFAQVTNPPIDPLRESEFMTLQTFLGKNENILETSSPQIRSIRLRSPIIRVEDYFRLRFNDNPHFKVEKIDCFFNADYEDGDLEKAILRVCDEAENAINNGNTLIFLSNHHIDEKRVPIPSLLSVGAVHHRLVEKGLRRKASIIVNASDAFETHHFATLISYGADAVYPRVAFETIRELVISKFRGPETLLFQTNYKIALEKGLLKILSKLGISTILSYKGAQTFEALGIGKEVIDLCFKGTISRISGLDFDGLAKEALVKHRLAFSPSASRGSDSTNQELENTGIYQWKRRGEYHLFNPKSIHYLQNSTRTNNYNIYKKYTEEINKQANNNVTLRSLIDFKKGKPIPIEEVESVENILKRFATGAMSFGSISYEAHTTLAIAMNRIGGKSNSGEGGEDDRRYAKKANGDWERSAIKQVASGRFGVSSYYLTNADEIQIKMAQGAKPGEGGQLPGHKVNDWIGRVRNATPGVGLISPPPHHDIYSIEDLAQLIFDLKNANRDARISVKLVSKAGVGIIASGVTKAHADHILISGHDGGTGASPLSSIRHAGLPWELGVAETHQTLVKNQLRNRVCIQADGQIRTGRDLAIATLLGAEEWGVATAALVVEGCILMRKCHLNTCPVGIATQREDLRAKFEGKVDHVVNYFNFLAKDLREIMAALGFRTINEMVGQSQFLQKRKDDLHWKANSVDLSPVFYKWPENELPEYCNTKQDHGLEEVLDRKLIKYSDLALTDNIPINSIFPIQNTDRAVGAMLSNEISKKYGKEGLKDDSISFRFQGSAGQSFGAFAAKGLTFTIEGDTNDYFGKGLSGGKIIVVPDRNAGFEPSENIIVGNVGLYGATAGEVYIRGKAGERFGVRNSGAIAVVEGVGAHGCEYMTGGKVIILGDIGRNFAAGMSGGIAYLLDPSDELDRFCNTEMVFLETPSEEDVNELRNHVRTHFRHTGSMKALDILNNWEDMKGDFIKVMPKEYKAVMAKKKAAKEGEKVPV